MEKKNEKSISRRGFLSSSGKTLFLASVSATAIPAFLSSCSKAEKVKPDSTDPLDELELKCGVYSCYDGFSCNQDSGFSCPDDNFVCLWEFECHESFSCNDDFYCIGQSSFTEHFGGQGG